MTHNDIVQNTRALAGTHTGRECRAWSIAWRALRLLERGAESARRSRLAEFDPHGPTAVGNPVYFVAAQCVRLAIPKPVEGEAAVYAALENAVDSARHVADKLYQDYVATVEKAKAETLSDPRRLARLAAKRSVSIVRAERFLLTTGSEA